MRHLFLVQHPASHPCHLECFPPVSPPDLKHCNGRPHHHAEEKAANHGYIQVILEHRLFPIHLRNRKQSRIGRLFLLLVKILEKYQYLHLPLQMSQRVVKLFLVRMRRSDLRLPIP
jgi:hypothetical protein